MQRQSELALQLMESSMEVESSVETHGVPIVARKLDVMHAPRDQSLEDGQTAPDFAGTMFALKGHLAGSRQNLADADNKHVENLRKVVELRQERDRLIPGLYSYFAATRQAVDNLFGKGKSFVLAGVEGPTAQKPNRLLRQAELAIARFLQQDLKLPAVVIEGFDVKPESVARGLQAKVDELGGVFGDLRVLRREVQASRKVKNRTLDEHKKTFLWTARALEGFYRLAGEHELADLIRPSERRPGRRAVEVPGDEPSAPEESTETPSEPSQSASEESTDSSTSA